MNEITVQELKEKIDKGEDFQLIDVREDFEYETSNLGWQLYPAWRRADRSEKL
jgi:rhodanese-related sulfurtransferase